MAETFADILQTKIREANFINRDFAKHADIKKKILDGILKQGDIPDNWIIGKLSKALGIDVEEIKSWISGETKTVQIPAREIVKADFKKKQNSPLKASGRFCIRCWFMEKKYVYNIIELAHYTGFRQMSLGKGKGEKVSHILRAPLCKPCHNYFDVDIEYKSVEKSEEFLFLISLFIAQEFETGNIIIKSKS